MQSMDEVRLRLARTEMDGAQAWAAATSLARRIVNSGGKGIADDMALALLSERVQQLKIAIDELAEVEELLSRAVTGKRSRVVRPHSEPVPCVRCHRTDGLFLVSVCARCSGLGPY
jgi:hypothetical protein